MKNQDIKSDYIINAILFFEEYKDLNFTEVIINQKYKELYERTWTLLENTMMSLAQTNKTPSFTTVPVPFVSPQENQQVINQESEKPKEPEKELSEKEKKDLKIKKVIEDDVAMDDLLSGLDAWDQDMY